MSLFSNIKFSIIGATGIVGQELLKILRKKNVPSKNIIPIASEKSLGKIIPYGNSSLTLQDLNTFDFSTCSISLFSAGSDISSVYALKAEKQGSWVIDNTSYFRMNSDISLVVPEINSHKIKITSRKIIANPNCSTIQLVMALKAIDTIGKIKRVIVSTYQSISGAGRSAVTEFKNQILGNRNDERFSCPMAYNVIPKIDNFRDDGSTKEEWKMIVETKKILREDIHVSATCVRVPVVCGHSEAVNFELEKEIPLCEIKNALRNFPGIIVRDQISEFDTPLEIEGRDEVFISRLRRDFSVKNGYQMWIVADNIRKGAALNALQIAEKLIEFGRVGG